MKLAFLSDAHCNSVGLAACLERVAEMSVDEIYFLGDAVGYFTAPAAVLELLARSGARCQQGNHEAMLVGDLPLDPERDRIYGLSLQREQLDADAVTGMAAWPRQRDIEVDGARLLLSHGSPAPSISEYFYSDTAWRPSADFPYSAVFMGHTHRPFVRFEGGVQLVNVGSCGAPRDRGDLAAFAIYDGATRETTVYRVAFDVERTLALHGVGIAPETEALLSRREDFYGEIL